MRSLSQILCLFLCAQGSFAFAIEQQTIPYQATVATDSVYVRSGPGDNHYPTTRLQRGETVTVVRHDPGGWFVIMPPQGSFSWIPSKYVQQTAAGVGEVVEDRIAVYVGSEFGDDEHRVVQRFVGPGEPLRILGEQVIQTNRGPEKMLKVAPPKREYRWVAGHFLVPKKRTPSRFESGGSDPQYGSQPVAVQPNSQNGSQPVRSNQPDWNDPNLKVANRYNRTRAPRRMSTPDGRAVLAQIDQDRRQLDQLDAQFKQLAMSDKSRWNFERIENGYTTLQNQTRSPALKRQIGMRFVALNKYKTAKAIYDDLTRLTNDTERRDAELLSMQGGVSQANLSSARTGQNRIRQTAGEVMTRAYYDAGARLPVRRPKATPPAEIRKPNRKGLIGAGIIERSIVPGTPKFVLLTPTGRILSYVDSDKVNLNSLVGKAMGLTGNRQFRRELKTDFIKVETAQPINLIR